MYLIAETTMNSPRRAQPGRLPYPVHWGDVQNFYHLGPVGPSEVGAVTGLLPIMELSPGVCLRDHRPSRTSAIHMLLVLGTRLLFP